MRQARDALRAGTEAEVGRAISEHALWPAGAALVVAVSGGADSLCLLGTLLALRAAAHPAAPGPLIVAHLDHALRPESAEDAAWVAQLAEELGLPCVVEREDVHALAAHRSLEDAARQARYAFLRRVAALHQAECIVTGHTRDDQAETVLLHLLRGSGLGGLAAMAPRSGDVARPLLEVPRTATVAYCAARGWPPRTDPTNADTRFTRNRIRHEVLPLLATFNPAVTETLARTATLLAADHALLEAQAAEAWAAVVVEESASHVTLEVEAMRARPTALRARVLRRAAACLAEAQALEARHVLALDALLLRGRAGSSLDLPGGLRCSLGYGRATFSRATFSRATVAEADAPAASRALPIPGVVDLPEVGWRVRAWYTERPAGLEGEPLLPLHALPPFAHAGDAANLPGAQLRVYLDAQAAGAPLSVRTWQPGDRFRPLGMREEKKLQDVFADAKVPRALRRRLPLVFGPAHLLWIGGQRIDDRVRIGPETRRMLVLQIEPLVGDE